MAFTALLGNSAVGGHLSVLQVVIKHVVGERGGYISLQNTTRQGKAGAVKEKRMDIDTVNKYNTVNN